MRKTLVFFLLAALIFTTGCGKEDPKETGAKKEPAKEDSLPDAVTGTKDPVVVGAIDESRFLEASYTNKEKLETLKISVKKNNAAIEKITLTKPGGEKAEITEAHNLKNPAKGEYRILITGENAKTAEVIFTPKKEEKKKTTQPKYVPQPTPQPKQQTPRSQPKQQQAPKTGVDGDISSTL